MSYDTTRPTRSIVIANTDPRTDVERIASLQRELAKATDQVCSLLDTASAYKADAERLRKAIETALRFRIEPLRVREALQAALTPPTAASGEDSSEFADRVFDGFKAQQQGEQPPSAPAAESEG